MGFSSVFKSLQEVFPQVDVRILKAVAIEHCKDADAAVEFILLEVLPSICSTSEASRTPTNHWDIKHPSICSLSEALLTPSDNQDVKYPSVGVEPGEHSYLLKHQELVEEANPGPPSEPRSVASEDANDTDHTNDALYINSTFLDELLDGSSLSNLHGGNDHAQLCLSTETEELESLAKHQEINVSVGSHWGSHVASSSMIHEDTIVTCHCSDAPNATIQDLNEVAPDYDSAVCRDCLQDQSFLDISPLEEENLPTTVQLDPLFSHKATPTSAECVVPLENDISSSIIECKKPGSGGSVENIPGQVVFDTEMVDVEDKSFSTTIVMQSGQSSTIDLLEDAIGDAKNNKKTLFSTFESSINMLKEVELQEKAAEQAKEEAARGGLDILAKMEDLTQMVQHAMETNDMHAGEIYGERAILATEVRELQSRLFNLSDERDKSLAILDEMRQMLAARLAAAEEERKAAEQEKLENEESVRKALAEQQLIVDKVVQESKKLQQEAEENLKLREFLMDRGHIVDTLQGEIAVICKDVKLLKQKFDGYGPISKSLSSSQPSCILASSSSSFKGLVSNRIPEQAASSETAKNTSPVPSIDGHSENSSPEEKGVRDDHKVFLDDEWDLFDDEAELYS